MAINVDSQLAASSSVCLPCRRWFSLRLRFLILVVGSGLIVLGLSSFVSFSLDHRVALDEVTLQTNEISNNTALQLNDRLMRLSESANAASADLEAVLQEVAKEICGGVGMQTVRIRLGVDASAGEGTGGHHDHA